MVLRDHDAMGVQKRGSECPDAGLAGEPCNEREGPYASCDDSSDRPTRCASKGGPKKMQKLQRLTGHAGIRVGEGKIPAPALEEVAWKLAKVVGDTH